MSPAKQIIENIYELSPIQQGMLYHTLMDRSSGEYFLQQLVRITGRLDSRMVEDSLSLLSLRHDMLRTSFVVPKSSGKPRQVLLNHRAIEIAIRDLRGEPEEGHPAQVEAIQTEEIRRGFDLEQGSLLRATLIRLKEEETLFLWNIHHIIIDGWSLPILIGDFLRYYTALRDGRPLETLRASAIRDNRAAPHYSDFIRWIRSQDPEQGLAWWRDLLDGYDEAAIIPPLGQPEPSDAFVSGVLRHLDPGISEEIQAQASARGITLNTVLETGWGLILRHYNFTDDVVFGKVVSGRDADLEGIQQMVGVFINTIPVRLRVEPGESVAALLLRQQHQALESGARAFCGLSDIQKQTPLGTKLIGTLFALENYFVSEQANADIPGLEIKPEGFREQVNYSIGMKAFLDGGIGMEILYNPNHYGRRDAEALMGRFVRLMEAIAEDMDRTLDSIDLLDDQERELILKTFNDTDAPNPEPMTIPPLFETVVQRQGEKAAIRLLNREISYRQLNRQADGLARSLRRMGIGEDDLVAITIHHRDFPYYVGLLGILKAGAAFLPLDHNNPTDRIAFILKDSGAKALLAAGDCNLPCVDIPIVFLPGQDFSKEDGGDPPMACQPESLAYCIYTSGTTGQPKGVLLEHRGLINQCCNMRDLGMGEDDTLIQFTNATFDVSVLEIFTAFLLGGTLVLVPEEVVLNNDHFSKYLADQQVTVAMLPPPYYRQSRLPPLRMILTGGSPATPEIVAKAADSESYYNGYGPTEITIASHFWHYEKGTEIPDPVPIGKAIRNTRHYILQGDALCGPGIPGELCLGGLGVARGYLNRPEATAEKFVPNPFGEGRIFRTGDRARWLPTGDVIYLGRMDTQVKVRGFRIELGEVESALRSLPHILEAVALTRPDAAGDNALYGYFTADRPLDTVALREDLEEILPAWMIPARLAQLDEIPLNQSHKPDRRALPDISAPEVTLRKPPKNKSESQILAVFQEALSIQTIGVNQDFFDLDGDSLKAIRIASKLTGQDLEISVKDIFSCRTVEELAKLADARRTGREAVFMPIGGGDPAADGETGRQQAGGGIAALAGGATAPLADEALLTNIQHQATAYAEEIAQGGILKKSALAPTQSLSIRMGVLTSYTQIEILMAWDAGRFQNVWRRLLREFPLLLCGVRADENGRGMRLDYGRLPSSVPFLDLSGIKESSQEETLHAAIEHIRATLPESAMVSGEPAHRILCVKLDAWRFLVILPISHLLFDGFSHEALAGRLNTLYGDPSAPTVPAPSYDDFCRLVLEGPADITDDQLVQRLELERFAEAADRWFSWRQQNKARIFHFEHPLPDYLLTGEQLLFMGAKLCAAILRFGSPETEIPLLLVHAARSYRDQNYADQIGEFIDLLPAILGADDTAVSLHNDRIALTRTHNINISALLTDPDIQRRYPRATSLLSAIRPDTLCIPVVNLLVFYGGIQRPPDAVLTGADASSEEQDTNAPFLTVMVTRKKILITGAWCPVGREEELRNQLSSMLHLPEDPS